MDKFTTDYIDGLIGKDGKIHLPSEQKTNVLMVNKPKGLTVDELSQRIANLNRTFNAKLIEKGYGMSLDELNTLNCIDLRNLYADYYGPDTLGPGTAFPDRTKMLKLLMQIPNKEISFFELLPCFEKGVLQINKRRWIAWEMEELKSSDVDTYSIIKIQDFAKSSQNGFVAGVSAHIRIRATNDKINNVNYNDNFELTDCITWNDIYKMLTPQELHWSEDDTYLWDKFTIQYASDFSNANGQNVQAELLMWHFITAISIVNYKLSIQSLSKGTKPKSNATGLRKMTTELTPQNAPKRLIRHLGDVNEEIIITSEKVPKKPSEEYVRHYSVAEWTVRATVRHYSNGKTVYIKEQTRRRHALNGTNQNKIPVTIKCSKTSVSKTKQNETND